MEADGSLEGQVEVVRQADVEGQEEEQADAEGQTGAEGFKVLHNLPYSLVVCTGNISIKGLW